MSDQDTVYPLFSADDMNLDGGANDAGRLRDMPRKLDSEYLCALVASGDYFETLATTLEEVAFTLPMASVGRHRLQDAVTQLLHLQQEYEITKRQLA